MRVASHSLAACRASSWINLTRLVDGEESTAHEARASEATVAANIKMLRMPGIYESLNRASLGNALPHIYALNSGGRRMFDASGLDFEPLKIDDQRRIRRISDYTDSCLVAAGEAK